MGALSKPLRTRGAPRRIRPCLIGLDETAFERCVDQLVDPGLKLEILNHVCRCCWQEATDRECTYGLQ
jgi:hypothetical protein